MQNALLAVIMLVGVCACGQRGDLFLRDNPPPGYKPAAEIYKPIPYPEQDAEEPQERR